MVTSCCNTAVSLVLKSEIRLKIKAEQEGVTYLMVMIT